MNILTVVLRLLHVFSGVFWVGSALFINFFVEPTAHATADAGQKFMTYLTTKSRFTLAMTTAAILTVLAGAILFWIDSSGFTSNWTSSAAGWGFGIGGIFGIIGLIFGSMVGKYSSALGKLGSQIQGKPAPEQMSRIQELQSRLKTVSTIDTISLILALLCMATARYW